MNKNVIIRKVQTKDAEGFETLVNKVWRIAYKDIFPEEVFVEKENKLEKKISTFDTRIKNDDKNISYVAECDGKIVGIMCGNINSGYDYFKNDYAELNSIYIDPDFQGMGIASEFKNIFEEWAISNGATKYSLAVLKDNFKARKVYEAWHGNLSDHEENFEKLGISYTEVFYTYDLVLKKELNKK